MGNLAFSLFLFSLVLCQVAAVVVTTDKTDYKIHEPITVLWSDDSTPPHRDDDYLYLVPTGTCASNECYADYDVTGSTSNSGSKLFPNGLPNPGVYDVRYLRNADYQTTVASTTLNIILYASISVQSTYALGEPIVIDYVTSAWQVGMDEIRIYDFATFSESSSYISYKKVPAATGSGSVSLDGVSDGNPKLLAIYYVYTEDNGYVPVSNVTFSIVSDVTLAAEKPVVQLGESIVIDWTAPATHGSYDWIYALWEDNSTYGYQIVQDGGSGSVTFPALVAKLGTLTFRYKINDEVWVEGADVTVTISASDVSISVPSQISLGELIIVNFTAFVNHSYMDEVLMFREGDTDYDHYIRYRQVPAGSSEGSLDFGVFDNVLGTYRFAYWANDGDLFITLSPPVTVVANYKISASPVAQKDRYFLVEYTSSTYHAQYDWVSLVAKGKPLQQYAAYSYVPPGATGDMFIKAPSETGQYYAHYLLDDGYDYEMANDSVTVADMMGYCHSSCINKKYTCTKNEDCSGCTGTNSPCTPNNIPVFGGPSPQDYFEFPLRVNRTIKFTLQASDPDVNDTLLITSPYLPPDASLTWLNGSNPATYIFEWTPTDPDSYYYYFEFYAIDPYGGISEPIHTNLVVREIYCYAWGDPHFGTFDGNEYNFQGNGEYHLFYTKGNAAITDTISYQIRQQPCYEGASVTCMNALAFMGGSSKVGIYMQEDESTFEIWINNTKASVTYPYTATFGTVTIVSDGSDFVITDTRGIAVKYYGDNVEVRVTDDWFTFTSGLCGKYDMDPNVDFVLPDGSVPFANAEDEQIYYDFGEYWRVSVTESLFVYATGSSWATVNNLTAVPQFTVDFHGDADLQAEAERVCGNLVLSANNYQGCLFDVAATNDVSRAFKAAALATRLCQLSNSTNCTAITCPDSCNLNGVCVNGTCKCNPGFSPPSCTPGATTGATTSNPTTSNPTTSNPTTSSPTPKPTPAPSTSTPTTASGPTPAPSSTTTSASTTGSGNVSGASHINPATLFTVMTLCVVFMTVV